MAPKQQTTRPTDPRYREGLELIELRHAANDRPEMVARQVRAAIQIAEDLLRDDPTKADYHFLLGYGWYNLDDAEPIERAKLTQRHFREALRLDPDHFHSRLYLAHELFDEKRYREARDEFERCASRPEARSLHEWQRLKLRELILACQWHETPQTFDLTVGMNFVDELCDLAEDERPRPTELIECIDGIRPMIDASAARLAKQFREMLLLA